MTQRIRHSQLVPMRVPAQTRSEAVLRLPPAPELGAETVAMLRARRKVTRG